MSSLSNGNKQCLDADVSTSIEAYENKHFFFSCNVIYYLHSHNDWINERKNERTNERMNE